ncbi:tolloid-like protein 2 [Amphiura filiformis]|uniref:tolloid-like protein 2 n=1 Tax=Amphiura filiformis TaxID=82378 RepID=UPI003B20E245
MGLGLVINENIVMQFFLWDYLKTALFNTTEMWIGFASNDLVQFRGFLIEIERKEYQVSCHPEEQLCHNGYGCLDPALVCNAILECIDGSDEWFCDYCPNTTITIQQDEVIEIISPFYPSYYPDGVDCFWFVKHEIPNGYLVVSFLTVSLHFEGDVLTIGIGDKIQDSAVIFRLSGSAAPRIATVNDSEVWIRFTTNLVGQVNVIGFNLRIEWMDVFLSCNEDEFLCHTGYGCLEQSLVCDSQPQCVDKSDENGCDLCGDAHLDIGSLTSFNLTSPRYPHQYPLPQDCLWMLTAPKDSIVAVEFIHLDTGVDYDKLFIAPVETIIMFDYDGYFDGVYHLYTGILTPRALVITQMQFQIAWDPSVWSLTSNTGFALYISLKNTTGTCDKDDFVCPIQLGLMCLFATQKCDGRSLCPDDRDEQNCGRCGVKNIYLDQTELQFNMTSPGFPASYYPNLECKWTILADDPNLIVIYIKEFQLERGFDFITFGNGDEFGRETIGSLTGKVKVSTITSSASVMWIAFETDDTGHMNGYRFELAQASSKNLEYRRQDLHLKRKLMP